MHDSNAPASIAITFRGKNMLKLWSIAALAIVPLMPTAHASVISVQAGDTKGLIAAIEQANQLPGADTIVLDKGWYVFERAADTRQLSALPTLRGQLRIIGNGSELRRYANENFRLLAVARNAEVLIDSLSFAEGSLGALKNLGSLNCRRCRFVDNYDRRSQGIIENYGELTLERALIGHNDLGITRSEAGTVLNYGKLELRDSEMLENAMARRIDRAPLAELVLNYGQAELRNVRLSDSAVAYDYSSENVAAVVNLGNGRVELSDVSNALVVSPNN
jgi:hypothetical protein